MRTPFSDAPGASLPFSSSARSASTAFALNDMSLDASPHAAEDRFIGVANLRDFLHNPPEAGPSLLRSPMEARYCQALETRMGLRGGDGLIVFGNSGGTPSPWADLLPADDPPGSPMPTAMSMSAAAAATPIGTPRQTPIEMPRAMPTAMSMSTAAAATPIGTPRQTPMGMPSAMPMSTREEVRGGCHTPIRSASRDAASGFSTPRRADGQQQQQQWATRVSNPLRTPVNASRCWEAYATIRTGVSSHTTSTAQLRTPVWHENDLLSRTVQMGGVTSGSVSQKISPLPSRSGLLFQHVSTRRQKETCDRVLKADGLSLSDASGRPNFSPLCWGYMGVLIALQRAVHLWQKPDKVFSILEVPPTNLVTAVTQTRHLPVSGDIFLAAGLDNGVIIVNKYPDKKSKSVAFDEGVKAILRHHDDHVSTLQIVGHQLFSGCMGGILIVHNLLSGVIVWQYDYNHSLMQACLVPRLQDDSYNHDNVNGVAEWRVDVGDPIYKLELTQNGEHVAVGTSDSLFVYYMGCLGPSKRKKGRLIMKRSKQPVRAFCWWGTPNQRDYASSDSVSTGGIFLNTFLLFAGGMDGSILYVYSVGNKKSMLSYQMAAPILTIVSSEASDEILVSLDIPHPSRSTHATDTTAADSESVPPLLPLHHRHRPSPSDDSAVGMVGPFDGTSGEVDPVDLSSDDEGLNSVLYVDRHLSVRPSHQGLGGTIRGQEMEARALTRPLLRGEETVARAAVPRPTSLRGGIPVPSTELLQRFQMREGGSSVERIGVFQGATTPSMYIARSPDGVYVATTGIELMLRIWRVFKEKQTERSEPCDFR